MEFLFLTKNKKIEKIENTTVKYCVRLSFVNLSFNNKINIIFHVKIIKSYIVCTFAHLTFNFTVRP